MKKFVITLMLLLLMLLLTATMLAYAETTNSFKAKAENYIEECNRVIDDLDKTINLYFEEFGLILKDITTLLPPEQQDLPLEKLDVALYLIKQLAANINNLTALKGVVEASFNVLALKPTKDVKDKTTNYINKIDIVEKESYIVSNKINQKFEEIKKLLKQPNIINK